MTARLTLICHAATEATRCGRVPADEDLDPAGAAMLAAIPPPKAGRWLSGPERRARRTATALAGRDVEIEPALRDWDLGAWTGRTLADLGAADPVGVGLWLAEPRADPHGGESLEALLARAGSWIAREAERGGRLAAVTHPAVVRAAVVVAIGGGAPSFWRIDVPPLARVRLSHDGRRWTLQGLVPPEVPTSSGEP